MSTLFSGATHKALSADRGLIKIWDVENEYYKESAINEKHGSLSRGDQIWLKE